MKCTTCCGRGTVMCSECKGVGGSFQRRYLPGIEGRNRSLRKEKVSCSSCDGKGRRPCPDCNGDTYADCDKCEGAGRISRHDTCNVCKGTGEVRTMMKCTDCKDGHVYSQSVCTACNGEGRCLPIEDDKSAGGRRFEDKSQPKMPSATPKHGDVKTLTLPGGATMEMIYVAPGSFMMGSPMSEEGRCDDEAQHRVTLTRGYWLGKYEVTQGQWQSVMGHNPSEFKVGNDRPVESVSWEDCQKFVKKVNARLNCGARLPTEAEWEYACRAGTTTAYHWGNELNGDKANCHGKYPCGTTEEGPCKGQTVSVGSYVANPWGFYDMHGNVREWCNDWYGCCEGDVSNPQGPTSGTEHVLRDGGWDDYASYCRSAYRGAGLPGDRDSRFGFRLCCSTGTNE
ncbi:MAG: SUMF1/EgtB/PvdO family nonheme iron enzyme [Kiritimatiellae bacterium]|nr:SUMF1/EgtB/PvdO family nonheme iron enzyme [Kiritimatiellia bacterium]